MTGQDVDRLFELLAIFRPGDRHLEDRQLRSAWLFVLKPYEPEDVRSAVAEYFRERKYWPDVTDIANLCPKITKNTRDWTTPDTDRHWKKHAELLERYMVLKRRRREAGLPETWREALEAGLTAHGYVKAACEAGLWVDTIM